MVKLELKKTLDFKTGKVIDKPCDWMNVNLPTNFNGFGRYRSPGVYTNEIDHSSVVLGGPSSTIDVYGDSGSPFIGYNTVTSYSDISTTSRLENQISLMEDATEISETVSVEYNQDLEYLRSKLTRALRIPRSFTM